MTNRRDFFKRASLLAGVAVMAPDRLVSAKEATSPFSAHKKRALRVAHITDVHILNQRNAETCFARVVEAINRMEDKPDFILNTGDTVMDENHQTLTTVETRWNTWSRIIGANDLKIYSALGNHDVWSGPDKNLDDEYKKDKRYGKQWAMDVLGMKNRYYSFSAKGWKFIALDSINGDKGYQLDKEQFSWLESELNSAGNQPVCVFNHVPILSMGALLYATKRKPVDEVKFPSGDMHNDHQQIKDLFQKTQNVKMCLSGHVHYVDSIEYLGVKYLCNGAVSGNWWGNPIALEEFPPVYAIIDLFEDGSIENKLVYYDTKL